jgi:O-antigen ligase
MQMKPGLTTNKTLSSILFILYILFFTGLIFSFRAISSSSSGLILLAGVFFNKQETGSFFSGNLKKPFIACCAVYFLFQLTSFLNSHDISEDWRQVQLKAGIVFIPLAVCCCSFVNKLTRKKLLAIYSILLAAAGSYCITMAFIHYSNTGDTTHFFYHPLVSPLKQHAVYFSLLVFIALLFLLEAVKTKEWLFNGVLHFTFVIFLSFLLILLSSRLVIIFSGLYLLFYFLAFLKTMKLNKYVVVGMILLLIAGMTLLFTTNNPVSNRFKEIARGDLEVVGKESYRPDDYFNGLQFRLLQWKLVPEILNEKKSWWTGVGPANAQGLLIQKYISKNMYHGKPGSADIGYKLYNTHDQLLESLLKNGIPGTVLFLLICFSMMQLAWKNKNRVLRFTIVLLLFFAFTESVLETQYGVIIFTFFPLFLSQD